MSKSATAPEWLRTRTKSSGPAKLTNQSGRSAPSDASESQPTTAPSDVKPLWAGIAASANAANASNSSPNDTPRSAGTRRLASNDLEASKTHDSPRMRTYGQNGHSNGHSNGHNGHNSYNHGHGHNHGNGNGNGHRTNRRYNDSRDGQVNGFHSSNSRSHPKDRDDVNDSETAVKSGHENSQENSQDNSQDNDANGNANDETIRILRLSDILKDPNVKIIDYTGQEPLVPPIPPLPTGKQRYTETELKGILTQLENDPEYEKQLRAEVFNGIEKRSPNAQKPFSHVNSRSFRTDQEDYSIDRRGGRYQYHSRNANGAGDPDHTATHTGTDTNSMGHRTSGMNAVDAQFSNSSPLNNWSPLGNLFPATRSSPAPLASTGNHLFSSPTPRTSNLPMSPGLGAPPGLQGTSLINPDQIWWVYKDSSGMEQGPFNGPNMQAWYKDGWLPEHLALKRVEEKEYTTLSHLKNLLNNHFTPFLVPLPPAMVAPTANNRIPGPPGVMAPAMSPAAASLQGWSPLRSQSPVTTPGVLDNRPLTPSQNGWPLARGEATLARSTSMEAVSFSSQVQVQSQVQSQGQTDNNATAPDVTSTTSASTTAETANATALETIATEVKNDIKNDIKNEVQEPQDVQPVQPLQKETKQEEPVQTTQEKPVQEHSQNSTSTDSTSTDQPKEQDSPAAGLQAFPPPPAVEAEPKKPKVLTSVAAPWASVTKKSEKKPSLAEIQALETKRKQKEAAAAASAAAQNAASEPAEYRKSSQPASPASKPVVKLSWASTPAPVEKKPIKTLAEIQKEELEAKKRQQRQNAEAAAAAGFASNTPSGIPYASIVKPSAGSQHSTVIASLPTSSSSSGTSSTSSSRTTTSSATRMQPAPEPVNHWTTVSRKKVSSGVENGSSSVIGATSSSASSLGGARSGPALARPVAVPASPTTSKYAGILLDLVRWCKNSIKGMNPGVNINELLSIILSLPSTPDSKDMIAEMIYANSSIMDGRKFAEDFLKRKQKADPENQTNTTDWSAMLQRESVAKNEDGWNSTNRKR